MQVRDDTHTHTHWGARERLQYTRSTHRYDEVRNVHQKMRPGVVRQVGVGEKSSIRPSPAARVCVRATISPKSGGETRRQDAKTV